MHDVRKFDRASRNILRLRAAADALVDRKQKSYRLFLNYAKHGDLQVLTYRHRASRTPVPEPFIWYVAECLAEFCAAMEDGGINDKQPEWKQISKSVGYNDWAV